MKKKGIGDMTTMDLQQFCSKDELYPYLMRPFSSGEFSYATNRHIMVRIPRREGIDPASKEFNPDPPLKGVEQALFAVPTFKLPPRPSADDECGDCNGRGYEHDCPDCGCTCIACDGAGKQAVEGKLTTTYKGVTLALRYVRLMLSLPRIEIAEPNRPHDPLLFRFDGGVGALMPMRGPSEYHVDVF